MNKIIIKETRSPVSLWIFTGIPVIFILGSPIHFLYEWSGKLSWVGIFVPVNESVWEHMKLPFWPMIIWWIAGYLILKRRNKVSSAAWFSSLAIALVVCILFIVAFFYTYTGAFGIESLVIDIISFLLAVFIALMLANRLYNRVDFNNFHLILFTVIIILMIAVFTVCTFNPPHIPLFRDSLTGTYGIKF